MTNKTGGPDFQSGQPNALEIANRISSPNAANFGGMLRRSGRMIYEDHLTDASATARWTISVSGAGGSVTMDNTKSFAGANSVKLLTGAVSGNNAGVDKIIPAFISKFGLDALVFFQATPSWTLDFIIRYSPLFTATSQRRIDGGIRLQSDGGAGISLLYLSNPASYSFTLVSSNFYFPGNAGWHEVKVTADPVNLRLGQFSLDGTTFDLSNIVGGMSTGNASADFPSVDVSALLITNKASAETVWLDEILVTTDEP